MYIMFYVPVFYIVMWVYMNFIFIYNINYFSILQINMLKDT